MVELTNLVPIFFCVTLLYAPLNRHWGEKEKTNKKKHYPIDEYRVLQLLGV